MSVQASLKQKSRGLRAHGLCDSLGKNDDHRAAVIPAAPRAAALIARAAAMARIIDFMDVFIP
jgi:hypothetical protein